MIKYRKLSVMFLMVLLLQSLVASSQKPIPKPVIGVVQSMDYDSLLAAAGYEYLVESADKSLSPIKLTDEQFGRKLDTLRKLKLNLCAFNALLPDDMKLVGPAVNDTAVLAYTGIVLKRCMQAGVKIMVFGCGGARSVPPGYDTATARRQFINIARKMAVQAKQYQVTLAFENLSSTETNFANTLAEAYSIVRAVNHPNLLLCANIFQMLKENESPAIIRTAGPYIVHCNIAEKENGMAPGTKGDDFTPYLQALKKAGYHNKIIIEARWDNLLTRAEQAYLFLQKQINSVYDNGL